MFIFILEKVRTNKKYMREMQKSARTVNYILFALTLCSSKTHPLRHISSFVLPSIILVGNTILPVDRHLRCPGTIYTGQDEMIQSRNICGEQVVFSHTPPRTVVIPTITVADQTFRKTKDSGNYQPINFSRNTAN